MKTHFSRNECEKLSYLSHIYISTFESQGSFSNALASFKLPSEVLTCQYLPMQEGD